MTAKSNQIILSDGRRLGFSEYGDTHGQPLMYFHLRRVWRRLRRKV
jgi:hypothetical protein